MTNFYWHIHHNVLIEPAIEPIAVRRAYIRQHKPQVEVAIRLHLMRRVPNLVLPVDYRKAWVDYRKAWADYHKAWADYHKAMVVYRKARVDYHKARVVYHKAVVDYGKAVVVYCKAGVDYGKAVVDCLPALEQLHSALCPNCPWDGKTIFPQESAK